MVISKVNEMGAILIDDAHKRAEENIDCFKNKLDQHTQDFLNY